MAVSTGAIVEHLDVVVDLSPRDLPGCVDVLLDPLLLQAAKKGFRHGIIPAVATSAHTGLQMMRMAEAPPRIAAKLRALIGMNQGVHGLASPHGHEKRVQYEFSGDCGLGGPAHNAAGVEVHHDGQIEPAFPRADIRDVGDPGAVRSMNGKSSLQCIGRQECRVASGVPGSSVAVEGFDGIGPHDSSDTVLATSLAHFAQIEKDPWGSIDAVARCIGRADQAEQPLILHRSIGEGFSQPGIEPATRYVEQAAHDSRIKLLPMGFDQDVLQSDILRSALIPHRPSQVSTTTLKGVR